MKSKLKIVLLLCLGLLVWLAGIELLNPTNAGEIRIAPKMLLQTKFRPFALDKIYVISLDRVPQRYANIGGQLDKLGLDHVRFKAVDGYELKIKDEKGNKFYGKDLKDGKVKFNLGQTYKILCPSMTLNYTPAVGDLLFGAGLLGFECSQREVWNDMIKNGLQHALIFEDDIGLSDDFLSKLNAMMAKAPAQWDIIYLLIDEANSKKLTKFSNNNTNSKIEPSDKLFSITSAYIISLDGARKALNNSPEIYSGIVLDTHLSRLVNRRVINAYKAYYKDNIVSDKANELGGSAIDSIGRVMQ